MVHHDGFATEVFASVVPPRPGDRDGAIGPQRLEERPLTIAVAAENALPPGRRIHPQDELLVLAVAPADLDESRHAAVAAADRFEPRHRRRTVRRYSGQEPLETDRHRGIVIHGALL